MTMAVESTFIFEQEKVYALRDGKVVAAAEDVEELEEQVEADEKEKKNKKATHIVTPGGLKGKIVSRVEGLWSDEVAVRLENGNIAHYHVLADTEFVTEGDTELVNPVQRLEEKLYVDYEPTREALEDRRQELASINREARDLIQKGASTQDTERLDRIALQTADETTQIDNDLQTMDAQDGEAFAPPAPYEMQVGTEQESFNGNDGSWLDNTIGDMIQEAESYDYKKLLGEGPEAMVADLDDAPLADQGAVQQIASGLVREKTAAADPSLREKFERAFLARVEEVRREELARRKETTKKEAAQQKDAQDDAPDESLFL